MQMSMLQEQAIQMISNLSDDNVGYLIDFMQRFMFSKSNDFGVDQMTGSTDKSDFMREMEEMRIRTQPYFTSDFDSRKIWEEAIDEKYDSVN